MVLTVIIRVVIVSCYCRWLIEPSSYYCQTVARCHKKKSISPAGSRLEQLLNHVHFMCLMPHGTLSRIQQVSSDRQNHFDLSDVFHSAYFMYSSYRGADESLARPTSRCRRTESIVSLEIHAILTETLGESALSYATVKNKVTKFKRGDFSTFFLVGLRTYKHPGYIFSTPTKYTHRSQWPRGLRLGYAAARLLRLWVRIPPDAWTSVVSVVCCQVEVSATG
jgi:hypothetical protein